MKGEISFLFGSFKRLDSFGERSEDRGIADAPEKMRFDCFKRNAVSDADRNESVRDN